MRRHLKKYYFYFIYLAVPGLSCGMWDLPYAACELLVAACEIQFPSQGWNLSPLHRECSILATGPPGKSLSFIL